MIRVAIVEDDREARESLRACLGWIAEKDRQQFRVSEFPSGTAFLGNYEPDYDLVFMDIEMPGMNGMETARALRKMDASVLLIFVTNMAQYAIAGYEVDGERIKEIQAVNAQRREAIANGMSLEEAMSRFPSVLKK